MRMGSILQLTNEANITQFFTHCKLHVEHKQEACGIQGAYDNITAYSHVLEWVKETMIPREKIIAPSENSSSKEAASTDTCI